MYKLTKGDKARIILQALLNIKDLPDNIIKENMKKLKQLKLKSLNFQYNRAVKIINTKLKKQRNK